MGLTGVWGVDPDGDGDGVCVGVGCGEFSDGDGVLGVGEVLAEGVGVGCAVFESLLCGRKITAAINANTAAAAMAPITQRLALRGGLEIVSWVTGQATTGGGGGGVAADPHSGGGGGVGA